jgi:hypothetical protein
MKDNAGPGAAAATLLLTDGGAGASAAAAALALALLPDQLRLLATRRRIEGGADLPS